MTQALASIRSEFLRYKALAEGAIAQLDDGELTIGEEDGRNSVAIIYRHLSGNFRSRFSDFLTSDGEKPWRDRDREFEARSPGREEVLVDWEEGWAILFQALDAFRVIEALHRSLAHASYHVGQRSYTSPRRCVAEAGRL
jgi:hypothetical protein